MHTGRKCTYVRRLASYKITNTYLRCLHHKVPINTKSLTETPFLVQSQQI